MRRRLEDKVAIITGGTSGIGRRTVEIFAEEGASVLIAARREDDGHELSDRLGDKVDFLKTDVSLETDVKRMIGYAVDRFGKLDCLFNNAGVPATHGSIATIPFYHEESTRNFLAEEFFAKFSTDVLLLEATPKDLKRLIKRMDAGRDYFPLLDADIMKN